MIMFQMDDVVTVESVDRTCRLRNACRELVLTPARFSCRDRLALSTSAGLIGTLSCALDPLVAWMGIWWLMTISSRRGVMAIMGG